MTPAAVYKASIDDAHKAFTAGRISLLDLEGRLDAAHEAYWLSRRQERFNEATR